MKDIDLQEGCHWLAESYFCKMVWRRRKWWRKWGNFQKHISCELLGQFLSNLICRVTYMEGIKYVDFIKISLMTIEIQGVENSKLVIPVTHLCTTRLSWQLTHDCVSWYIYLSIYLSTIYLSIYLSIYIYIYIYMNILKWMNNFYNEWIFKYSISIFPLNY